VRETSEKEGVLILQDFLVLKMLVLSYLINSDGGSKGLKTFVFSVVVELLSLKSLQGTTTGEDLLFLNVFKTMHTLSCPVQN
jgi:hypothetical protein